MNLANSAIRLLLESRVTYVIEQPEIELIVLRPTAQDFQRAAPKDASRRNRDGLSWSVNSEKRRAYGNDWRQRYPSKTQSYCELNNSAIVPWPGGVYEYSEGPTIPGHPQLGRGKADRDRSVPGRCRCRARAAGEVEGPQRLARQQSDSASGS